MRASDFHYKLPEDLIAQEPPPSRGGSRLLVLHRDTGRIEHRQFSDLAAFLKTGDLLVLNDSRVIRARLFGSNERTGGRFEMLLVEPNGANDWWTMLKPGRRARIGTRLIVHDHADHPTAITATVAETNDEGHRRLQFEGTPDIVEDLDRLGVVPLPPYIRRQADASDAERYQTVFAREKGSVAAPTAGLHFTPETLDDLRARGIRTCSVTLHVGLGTFAPVKVENIDQHVMHEERYSIPPATVDLIRQARSEGRRVIAVGTTSIRTLESSALANDGSVESGEGRTRLFVRPPFDFQVVDGLLTNFHLPCSTLLMLVSAFVTPGKPDGREILLAAYAEAIRERYRFFSYGDAMLIL